MRQFVVGGAVRDVLLGRKPKDVDFVWTGATPQDMLNKGFTQVGADFPVFLDEAGNEHALARTERKVGSGYNGFETSFDPSITLKDDLRRRDLTFNALAVDVDQWEQFLKTRDEALVIDPFYGINDLRKGIMRHVEATFAEDPLRVLRVARFAARFRFTVADETLELMTQLVESGEVDHLTKERVWQEMSRAVMEDFPECFFRVLHRCGAEQRVLGITDTLDDISWFRLQQAAELSMVEWQRWVAFFNRSDPQNIEPILQRWNMPLAIQKRVMMALRFHKICKAVKKQDSIDACFSVFHGFRLNQPENFQMFAEVIHTLLVLGLVMPTVRGEWCLKVMKAAGKVVQSDPKLVGREISIDLDQQRKEIFSKYPYGWN